MVRQVLLAAALIALSSSSASAEDPTPQSLSEQAVAANPTLESMRASERELRATAEVAGAWPDPMVALEYSNVPVDSWRLSDHPMAGLQIRAQQTLRPPTWSRLHREVGTLRADAMGFAVEEAESRLRASVEKTWYLLARTRLLEEVTRQHLARAEELLAAARARYETGGVGQHAVLRLEVLRDRLGDDLGDFQRGARVLVAALAQALGRDDSGPFPTPSGLVAVEPPTPRDWVALARENRPLLRQIDAQREAAEQRAKLARVDAIPDPSVWAGYRIRTVETATDPGTDLVAIGLGIPIPSGSGRRARGDRTAALERADAEKANFEAVIDSIGADMESALARWSRAWQKSRTYDEGLVPGARATLDATRADFSVGRADFASLFEAEVALLDLERARIDAVVETHLQRADAAAVLGTAPTGGTE